MNRRAWSGTIVACSAAIAATSCAAILGIDDVSVKDGGASDASLFEASSPDAGNFDAPFGNDYASVVMIDEPIAYWKLDDINNVAMDSTPNHLDATYAPGIIHGPSVISDPTGASADFPGSPDGGRFGPAITLPPNPLLEIHGAITIEAWIRPFNTDESQLVTYGQQALPPFQPWGLQVGPPLELFTSCCGQINGTNPLTSDSASPMTYYVVGTFDGITGAVLYVNGVRDGSSKVAGPLGGYDNVNGLGIGAGFNSGLPFRGLIDEVAIYDKALSPDRILAHYNAGK